MEEIKLLEKFSELIPEMKINILMELSPNDIINLRIVNKKFFDDLEKIYDNIWKELLRRKYYKYYIKTKDNPSLSYVDGILLKYGRYYNILYYMLETNTYYVNYKSKEYFLKNDELFGFLSASFHNMVYNKTQTLLLTHDNIYIDPKSNNTDLVNSLNVKFLKNFLIKYTDSDEYKYNYIKFKDEKYYITIGHNEYIIDVSDGFKYGYNLIK